MRLLTRDESAQWLRQNGFHLEADFKPGLSGEHHLLFSSPKETRQIQMLVRELLHWFGAFDEALLWLTDWPFYEADEMALVNALRESDDEHEALIKCPGHLVTKEEIPSLTAFLYLLIMFGWDGHLYARPFRNFINTSHEDFIHVGCDSEAELHTLKKYVLDWGLEILGES